MKANATIINAAANVAVGQVLNLLDYFESSCNISQATVKASNIFDYVAD